MDQLTQCPVCTLFLHSGMTLESHLDTHPKDQVIKALCSLTAKGPNYGSRTSTPLHSERSYRSRSRTPATEDGRWDNSHRSTDQERYWHRTSSRTPKTNSMSNASRISTPDIRLNEMNFDSGSINNPISHPGTPFVLKADKLQSSYQPPVMSEFDQPYVYYQDQNEDREIKYSRSAEYNALDSSNSMFTYNMPTMVTGVKLLPTAPRRGNDIVKILPKSNNILLKTNIGGMQYIGPAMKPMHVVVPTAPTFLQKNVQNNMVVTGNMPNTQGQIETKTDTPSLSTNLNQITSNTFTPGTTVVTQNSQIIYREMVHNLEGKPFVTSMPTGDLGGHDNVTNVGQASSMYQNVMVVDQFDNTSCMYTTPQPILPKACTTSIYSENESLVSNMHVEKPATNINDPKTLIIEVGSIVAPPESNTVASCTVSKNQNNIQQRDANTTETLVKTVNENSDVKYDIPGPSKGLKILSNIKVEVPVQHHKNMVNTIMDLTGPNETDYQVRVASPDKILPDLDDKSQVESKCEKNLSDLNECTSKNRNTETLRILPGIEDNSEITSEESTLPSTASVSHTFSVIKNVGKPPSKNKEFCKNSDSKIDTESSDSCPVPDLICNEKPSISPCCELSEHGDNSTDHTLGSPKPEKTQKCCSVNITENKTQIATRANRNNTLRLNNIYVKKHKKVLQIKNAKSVSNTNKTEPEPLVSSSKGRSKNFTKNMVYCTDRNENKEKNSMLHTISVEEIKDNDNNEFDANIEEQSMDIEPVASSSINNTNVFSSNDGVHVKEEINTSNEGHVLTPLETLRPINVITYGNMASEFDDESNDRELLDLEAASKNKQFVNMMNENYFGDNIYADYFTSEQAFDAVRETTGYKEGPKDSIYNIWGEPSQKQNEFVLPNFIHESYKIADSTGGDYTEMDSRETQSGDVDGCERDSKVDVLSEGRSESEAPLNICANERMPPRGELSGQESNGDTESPWTGMYNEIAPTEPYDLIARESWVSDGSDVDANEKRDTLEEDLHFVKSRMYTCVQCCAKFTSVKEMRTHKSLVHALPTCSTVKTTYSRLVTARTIKKEETQEKMTLTNNLLTLDSRASITSTILQVYETMDESKPKIEGLIKQAKKRRRKDYVCATCKVDQSTETAFNAHLKIHPLECLTCGKCFFKRANLALHMKIHLGIKNYKCEVCEKRFITRQKLVEHHNVHTGRAPIKCTLCDDTFRRYSNMVQHRDRHHLSKRAKVRDFVCQCGLVFHSRAKLRWHRETHDERPKACLYCSDKFVHSASLTRHVRRVHNEYYLSDQYKGRAENVPCPVCKQIYLRTNLRAHLQTHTGQRPYHCIICNKYFTTKWNLKLHRWTHMSRSAKPYKCKLCKGAFIRQSEFISHMNAHKSVRPYTCNYCGCQFIRKYNCQRHVREHEMGKKYVCKVPECGKSFHRSYYLSEHMKVHSGARPFSCNICGKTSSNKSNHNKHVKIHHAREPVATET